MILYEKHADIKGWTYLVTLDVSISAAHIQDLFLFIFPHTLPLS